MAELEEEIQREEQRDPLGEAPLARRLAAEFVGTLLLVAVGSGAATVLALGPLQRLGFLKEQVQGFAEATDQVTVFSSLLGAGPPTISELLPVAFAFATILAVLVYAFGGTSGGHFNPAVSFALAVSRRFRWSEVPVYWVAQVLGGIAGAFVIAGIFGELGAKIEDVDILFGATAVADNIDTWNAILAEAFITFILMSAIMAVAIDPRAPKGWSGLIIGLALGAGILVTGAATGGSANFARSLGPLVASLPYDPANIPWRDLIVYAIGPLVGASAAALVYETVTGLEAAAPAPTPGAATTPEGADVAVILDEGPPPTTGTDLPGSTPPDEQFRPPGA